MLAMDGPMVMNWAYAGTFASIQAPASRPPGTPPVPARNSEPTCGWIRCQLAKASDATTATEATQEIKGGNDTRRETSRPCRSRMAFHEYPSNLPAKIASGGAMGNQYWKPFTGHSWKKTAG